MLTRGLFVRELVSHGHRDIDFLVNVLYLCRAHGSLYSFHRGNLALHRHGNMAFHHHGHINDPVDALDLWVLHGLVCSLHCEDLFSVVCLCVTAGTSSLCACSVRGVESARRPDSVTPPCGGALVVSLVPVNRSVIGVQGEHGEKQDEERPGVFSKAMV